MEEYQFKFMTVQLEERADAMREYAHKDNIEKCREALAGIERLIPQLKSFLNDKRNVQRGEEKSSCQHKFQEENPHLTRCLKCGKKWTLG